MPAPDLVVAARGLSRSFGAIRAVDRLDLQVRRGAFLALVGPNGSGKSTTVRLLSGLLARDAGDLSVLGRDPAEDALGLAERIGIVPDFPVLFDVLTVRENVRHLAAIRQLPRRETEARLDELADALRMRSELDTPVHGLSTGTCKKASLAAAMIHAPALLFLDEPFEGIDPIAANAIREMLTQLRERGTTLLVTSHVLPVMQAMATDVAILDEGKLVMAGTLDELLDGGSNLERVMLDRLGTADRVPELGWYRP